MKQEDLNKIKEVFDMLNKSISDPIKINQAYKLLPNSQEIAPMRARISAIHRFMTFNYQDEIISLNKDKKEIISEGITDSIGTMENLPYQSHKEDFTDNNEDIDSIDSFLTSNEKTALKSISNTIFEIEDENGKTIKRSGRPKTKK